MPGDAIPRTQDKPRAPSKSSENQSILSPLSQNSPLITFLSLLSDKRREAINYLCYSDIPLVLLSLSVFINFSFYFGFNSIRILKYNMDSG